MLLKIRRKPQSRKSLSIKGKTTFGKLERDLIESGLPSEASVVACGGGLALQDGMMDTLKSKGVSYRIICF